MRRGGDPLGHAGSVTGVRGCGMLHLSATLADEGIHAHPGYFGNHAALVLRDCRRACPASWSAIWAIPYYRFALILVLLPQHLLSSRLTLLSISLPPLLLPPLASRSRPLPIHSRFPLVILHKLLQRPSSCVHRSNLQPCPLCALACLQIPSRFDAQELY